MLTRFVRKPVVLALILAACSGGNALAPQFQPQVTNNPDNFQLQATGVTNVTQVLTYTWSCSTGTATVNPATTTSGGSVSLLIKDGAGTTVYNGNIPPSGTFNTSPAGVSGAWTIKVTFNDYSGTINFRVQKF
jgi:hypothetical protein